MRVALFGGRFDPVHIGHLIVAQDAAEILKVDRLFFIPSHNPPHKPAFAPFPDRYAMVQRAVANHPLLDVLDVEYRLALPRSYTVEVLKRLLPELGAREVFFLLGADEFRNIHSWYRYEELFRMVEVVVLKRPFYEVEALPEMDRVSFIGRREVEVSSSEIRRRIREGRPFRYLVPEPVYTYLVEHGLYRNGSLLDGTPPGP